MTDLRCLSLHQPWATLIAARVKTIIDRDKPTKHRGRIGIASTKRTAPNNSVPIKVRMKAAKYVMQYGVLMATANLVDCVAVDDITWATEPGWRPEVLRSGADHVDYIFVGRNELPYGDFTPGRWAWLLDDVKATTERCPACWGTPGEIPARCCWTCLSNGRTEPIPVKGHQGLWRWESA